jgi:hypothetical protein
MWNVSYEVLITVNFKKTILQDVQCARIIAMNHRQILLVCCLLIRRHVSACTQEAIIRLIKRQTKSTM